jgi:hypothetical protein
VAALAEAEAAVLSSRDAAWEDQMRGARRPIGSHEGDTMGRRKAKGWDKATVASLVLASNRLEMLCDEFDAAVEAHHEYARTAVCVDLFRLAGAVLGLPAFHRSPMEMLADTIVDRLTAKPTSGSKQPTPDGGC